MSGDSLKPITLVMGGLTGGGAERVAARLMGHWVKKGREVTLISMRDEIEDIFTVPHQVKRIVLGGEGESTNKFTALVKNFFYITKLRRVLKEIDSPVILSFLTRANIYSIIACFGLRKYLVISERNDTARQPLRWPWHTLRKKLYKYADVITANSYAALENMKSYVPPGKLYFVPNPVFLPDETDVADPGRSKIILNVARLAAHKSQNLIIEALSVCLEKNKEWSLVILGEGEEREKLLKLAENKEISGHVMMPGFVNNPSEYYKSAAIFVLPSQYEGTPNALLEAMGYGLPCIISDSLPGALELIDDGVSGMAFRSGDAGDLSDQLAMLIDNPELRKKLGSAARNKISMFKPEKAFQAWDNVTN